MVEKAESLKQGVFVGGNVGGDAIAVVNSANANIASLRKAGREEIADALSSLKEEIIAASELDDKKKKEALEQVNALAEQANLPEEKRTHGVIKAMFDAVASTVKGLGKAATAWQKWGAVISKFFGI